MWLYGADNNGGVERQKREATNTHEDAKIADCSKYCVRRCPPVHYFEYGCCRRWRPKDSAWPHAKKEKKRVRGLNPRFTFFAFRRISPFAFRISPRDCVDVTTMAAARAVGRRGRAQKHRRQTQDRGQRRSVRRRY